MGSCVSKQSSDGDMQDKDVNSKCHDKMVQQPSLEEAIERNERMKELLENEISDLQQQLEENRYILGYSCACGLNTHTHTHNVI